MNAEEVGKEAALPPGGPPYLPSSSFNFFLLKTSDSLILWALKVLLVNINNNQLQVNEDLSVPVISHQCPLFFTRLSVFLNGHFPQKGII
jgi:hypothetical protein